MMVECFCGCGRRIKGLRRRGYNTAGRDALATIALLDHAEGIARERGRGDIQAQAEAFAALRKDGQRHVEAMKYVTHGSKPYATLGEFKAWQKNVRGLASFVSLDPRVQSLMSAGASVSELRDAQENLA